MRILVLHGINLNMFGKREASVYGTTTLAEIDESLQALAKELGAELECFQTNSEARSLRAHSPRGHRKEYVRGADQRRRMDALQLRPA